MGFETVVVKISASSTAKVMLVDNSKHLKGRKRTIFNVLSVQIRCQHWFAPFDFMKLPCPVSPQAM
jgi:hypothetical protein